MMAELMERVSVLDSSRDKLLAVCEASYGRAMLLKSNETRMGHSRR